MKAIIETSLIKTCNVPVHESAGDFFDGLFSSLKRIKRSLQDAFPVGKSENSLFIAFLRQRKRKAQLSDQAIKDEFFFRCKIRRKNIPQRTWNRHSAFLFYRQQQVDKQMLGPVTEMEQKSDVVMKDVPESAGRMSFKVKSIQPLPVWASACHELTWIEPDLSSLRFMQFPRVESPAAKAA